MTAEEYLRTGFEDGDREFVDGEVVERNIGESPHSTAQMEAMCALANHRPESGIQVLPTIRIQTSPTRVRVADIAVWRPGDIGTRIPTVPPFLVVEILSPEDRMARMQEKVAEYLAIGAEYVWLIDPEERKAIVYSRRGARVAQHGNYVRNGSNEAGWAYAGWQPGTPNGNSG
jgi:Uma2 family endonuclease